MATGAGKAEAAEAAAAAAEAEEHLGAWRWEDTAAVAGVEAGRAVEAEEEGVEGRTARPDSAAVVSYLWTAAPPPLLPPQGWWSPQAATEATESCGEAAAEVAEVAEAATEAGSSREAARQADAVRQALAAAAAGRPHVPRLRCGRR